MALGPGAARAARIPERLRTIVLSDGETYILDFADGSGGGEFWMQPVPGRPGWKAPTMRTQGMFSYVGGPPTCRTKGDALKVKRLQQFVAATLRQ